eukprot:7802791-Pyramimonas_sp.AAC.1
MGGRQVRGGDGGCPHVPADAPLLPPRGVRRGAAECALLRVVVHGGGGGAHGGHGASGQARLPRRHHRVLSHVRRMLSGHGSVPLPLGAGLRLHAALPPRCAVRSQRPRAGQTTGGTAYNSSARLKVGKCIQEESVLSIRSNVGRVDMDSYTLLLTLERKRKAKVTARKVASKKANVTISGGAVRGGVPLPLHAGLRHHAPLPPRRVGWALWQSLPTRRLRVGRYGGAEAAGGAL